MELHLDGSAVRDIPSFYDEINRIFMAGEDWDLAPSLDALDDLLYGGFGVAQHAAHIELIWTNVATSQGALGYEETRRYYKEKLEPGSPFQKPLFEEKLAALESGSGPTYFDLVMEVFAAHPHITVILR